MWIIMCWVNFIFEFGLWQVPILLELTFGPYWKFVKWSKWNKFLAIGSIGTVLWTPAYSWLTAREAEIHFVFQIAPQLSVRNNILLSAAVTEERRNERKRRREREGERERLCFSRSSFCQRHGKTHRQARHRHGRHSDEGKKAQRRPKVLVQNPKHNKASINDIQKDYHSPSIGYTGINTNPKHTEYQVVGNMWTICSTWSQKAGRDTRRDDYQQLSLA